MQQWRIGCSGFHYKDWKNIFYPEKLPQSKWFDYYCTQFNTLELNVTFYRFPQLQFLKAWYDKSPEHFSFSVKAPRLITHYKKFKDCKRLLNDFYTTTDKGLHDKLGCVLFQLPSQIEYSEDKLELIVSSLHSDFKNVIEFRHKSWWSKKVYDYLKEKQICFCIMDHPRLPKTVVLNTSFAYVRMHGNPKLYYSFYDNKTLKSVYHKIAVKKKIEAYIYFNNTATIAAIENARYIQDLANKPV